MAVKVVDLQAQLFLQKLIEACFDEQSFCPHRLEA
jgi:hypothetical protein